MFSLRRPSRAMVLRFLAEQGRLPYSYAQVGASRGGPPVGFVVDQYRVCLGVGADVFARGQAALRRWAMFELGWVVPCWSDTPIVVGATVGVVVRWWEVWVVNACRIVYVVDEVGPVQRFGFAYGTLPGHAECGEERFMVEWRRDDGSVWYDVLAFSRPQHPLAMVGYPVTRGLQRRFARDSKCAMVVASADGGVR